MFVRALDGLLKEDPLYLVLKRRGTSLSFGWRLKRALRVLGARVLPAPVTRVIGRLNEVAYFRYHRFRPRHWLTMRRNLREGNLEIGVMSGLGDVLMLYPYLKCYHQKYPAHKVTVVMHHEDFCRYPAVAHVKHREVTLPDGSTVDFVREILETNPNIDAIRYGDAWDDGVVFSWPPLLRREFGEQFRPSSFRSDLEHLWSDDDKVTISTFRDRHGLDSKFCVGIHFKTCGDLIEPLALELFERYRNRADLFVIVCGSVPEQIIHGLEATGLAFANLSGSYDQGINTRCLLGILGRCDLFIGGRGGFDVFPRLCGVPSLNIWDLQGRQEDPHLWPTELWEGNPLPAPEYGDSTSVDELTETAIHLIGNGTAPRE